MLITKPRPPPPISPSGRWIDLCKSGKLEVLWKNRKAISSDSIRSINGKCAAAELSTCVLVLAGCLLLRKGELLSWDLRNSMKMNDTWNLLWFPNRGTANKLLIFLHICNIFENYFPLYFKSKLASSIGISGGNFNHSHSCLKLHKINHKSSSNRIHHRVFSFSNGLSKSVFPPGCCTP